MQVSDGQGMDDVSCLVPRCPVALSEVDSNVAACPCVVVRKGTVTRHGVISSGFPEAISGVPRYHCSTHGRSFTILNPLVHEALPPDSVVLPEVVVLTNDLLLHKSAYLSLAVQVGCLTQLTLSRIHRGGSCDLVCPVLEKVCTHAGVRFMWEFLRSGSCARSQSPARI